MKKYVIHTILGSLVMGALLMNACTKEPADVRLDPKLSTSQVINVKWDSATVIGFVVASGSGFTQRGICYDTIAAPNVSSNTAIYTGQDKKATFPVRIGGLKRLTKYYARAYAVNASGTLYGEELNFTTTAALPTIDSISPSTLSVTTSKGIIGRTAITISDDGGPDKTANITARGVVFGFYPHPTVDSLHTTEGGGKGTFTSVNPWMKGNKMYYLRAYATNQIGTTYSNEVSFTTPLGYAFITTSPVTGVGKTSVTFNGLVTENGGATITERGFCYGTSANPTVTGDKIVVDGTNDTVSAQVTGLSVYTAYHVRAYVINEVGVNYGLDVKFTTLPDITKFFVVGGYNGWDNSDNAKFIISTASDPESQGYVYFDAAGEFKLTTDHSWSDPATFGDDGTKTGKLTNPGANIAVPEAGYYWIKASQPAMTYSILKTDWGVIGSATPNGWNDETALDYDIPSGTWRGVMHLLGGNEIKFRANHSWDYNYGSTAKNDSLNPGGDNIAIDIESDYAIVLDLSHPNSYKYTKNRWGVIGDATAGGWSSDQNMTWDATNHVFTVTLDLVAGSFKFRANDDWAVNYGGSLSGLTAGGDNIAVASAGNYTITFDPWALTASVKQNKKKK